jgi:hypothetical protein
MYMNGIGGMSLAKAYGLIKDGEKAGQRMAAVKRAMVYVPPGPQRDEAQKTIVEAEAMIPQAMTVMNVIPGMLTASSAGGKSSVDISAEAVATIEKMLSLVDKAEASVKKTNTPVILGALDIPKIPTWAYVVGAAATVGLAYWLFGKKKGARRGVGSISKCSVTLRKFKGMHGLGRRACGCGLRGAKMPRPTKIFMKKCITSVSAKGGVKDPAAICANNWLYQMKPKTRAAYLRRQKKADAQAKVKVLRAKMRRQGKRVAPIKKYRAVAGLVGNRPARSFLKATLRDLMRVKHMPGPQAMQQCHETWKSLSTSEKQRYAAMDK